MTYKLSRDYRRLWAALQVESVVCFADYETWPSGEPLCRDVCSTIWTGRTASISCRGTGYVMARNEEDFVRACEEVNIEALFPEAVGA